MNEKETPTQKVKGRTAQAEETRAEILTKVQGSQESVISGCEFQLVAIHCIFWASFPSFVK